MGSDVNFYEALKAVLDEKRVLKDELLACYTTFKVGGKADFLVKPKNCGEVVEILKVLSIYKKQYIVLGGCSNVLVRDKGIRGVVIKIDKDVMNKIQREGEFINVEAGASLADVAKMAVSEGYAGLEFAVGIPGSVGGAVFMNAGAYNGEMSNVVHSVNVVMADGSLKSFKSSECGFLYRKSIFQCNGAIILSVVLRVQRCVNEKEKEAVKVKADEYTKKRESKQPLEWASAGSTFKRPEGYFVGPLIEKAGLKGCKLGGAQVSEKHAGFIVNKGDATAKDILQLIQFVREQVKKVTGVSLEPEVRILGE